MITEKARKYKKIRITRSRKCNGCGRDIARGSTYETRWDRQRCLVCLTADLFPVVEPITRDKRRYWREYKRKHSRKAA